MLRSASRIVPMLNARDFSLYSFSFHKVKQRVNKILIINILNKYKIYLSIIHVNPDLDADRENLLLK